MALNNVDKAWMRDETRAFKETPSMQELRKSNVGAYGSLVSKFERRVPPEDIEKDDWRAVYERGIAEMRQL